MCYSLNFNKNMPIPKKISVPDYPKFLFAPDHKAMELYIVCSCLLTLFWVRQTIPAQIYILEGKPDEKLLRECADWYRANAGSIGIISN